MPNAFEDKKIASKAGRKSKRPKDMRTIARQTLGKDESYEIRLKVLENIKEAIYSKDKNTRLRATKDFADYFLPKKREHTGDLLNDITIEVKLAED